MCHPNKEFSSHPKIPPRKPFEFNFFSASAMSALAFCSLSAMALKLAQISRNLIFNSTNTLSTEENLRARKIDFDNNSTFVFPVGTPCVVYFLIFSI